MIRRRRLGCTPFSISSTRHDLRHVRLEECGGECREPQSAVAQNRGRNVPISLPQHEQRLAECPAQNADIAHFLGTKLLQPGTSTHPSCARRGTAYQRVRRNSLRVRPYAGPESTSSSPSTASWTDTTLWLSANKAATGTPALSPSRQVTGLRVGQRRSPTVEWHQRGLSTDVDFRLMRSNRASTGRELYTVSMPTLRRS